MKSIKRKLEEKSVETKGGCREWKGGKDRSGYGLMTLKVHRLAWELAHGEVPPGLVLDHLCRNPACCNPDHLEPVTNGENVRRGVRRRPRQDNCGKCGKRFDKIYFTPLGNKRKKCTACTRAYRQGWSEEHPNYQRAWYEQNRERLNAEARARYAKKRGKVREYRRLYPKILRENSAAEGK